MFISLRFGGGRQTLPISLPFERRTADASISPFSESVGWEELSQVNSAWGRLVVGDEY